MTQSTESGPARHTQGPWEAKKRGVYTSAGVHLGGFNTYRGGRRCSLEDLANARLAAAAPDFYRGALLVVHSPPDSEDFDLGMTILCNLIDRTEGREVTP